MSEQSTPSQASLSENNENDKITWASVPYGYALCIYTDCPLASHCQRAIAYGLVPQDQSLLTIANPLQCTQAEGCPHYRDAEPVVNAYGFKKICDLLAHGQYKTFALRLQKEFGKMGYYRRRKGERVITPAEQAFIKQVLADMGAPSSCDFDAYRTEQVWKDL